MSVSLSFDLTTDVQSKHTEIFREKIYQLVSYRSLYLLLSFSRFSLSVSVFLVSVWRLFGSTLADQFGFLLNDHWRLPSIFGYIWTIIFDDNNAMNGDFVQHP